MRENLQADTFSVMIFFGIGRFITNQQNIYRVTPVQCTVYTNYKRQRKRHEKEQYNIEGEKREFMATTFVC